MKKLLLIILTLAMIVSLFGCGGKDKGPEPGTPVSSFYDAILAVQPEDAGDLIFFEESNPALINSFYPGLNGIELSRQAFYMPLIATRPCEIALVEVKDAANVQAVADIFRTRIDLGANNMTYPESAAG